MIRLFAVDHQGRLIKQMTADPNGRFRLPLPADGAYQLHTLWPGNSSKGAISAVLIGIEAGLGTVNLRIVLTQSGNSHLEMLSKTAKTQPWRALPGAPFPANLRYTDDSPIAPTPFFRKGPLELNAGTRVIARHKPRFRKSQ